MRPLIVALMLAAAPAHAAFHVAVSVGVGVGSGPLSWNGASRPVLGGDPPPRVSWDTALGGVALDLDVTAATDVSPTLALGLTADAMTLADELRTADLGRSSYGSAHLFTLGVRAIVRPPGQRWIYRVGAGLTECKFHGDQVKIASYDNVVTFDAAYGPGVDVSVGRRLGRVGTISLQLRAAALSNEHTTYVPVFLSARFGLTTI